MPLRAKSRKVKQVHVWCRSCVDGTTVYMYLSDHCMLGVVVPQAGWRRNSAELQLVLA